MTEKFMRDIKVVAGPFPLGSDPNELVIEPSEGLRDVLKMRFDITQSNNREANKGSLSIWNLKEESRSKLQEEDSEVLIEAGYVGDLSQIFLGDLEKATNGRDSVNWITEIELGDGTSQLGKSRINLGLRGGQTPGAILKKAAQSLGLDVGNLDEKVSENGVRSVRREFINNVILSGKASDVLDEVASSLGYNFSIQGKKLQFLAKGEALKNPPVPLDLTNGLIGSPQVGEKGVVEAKSLLNGRFVPGQKIALASLVASGEFVAQKVQHVGDTWGDEWSTNVEMTPL
jgi:hypothetical protein